MRSSTVSTWPNIMVAVEARPSRCATSITFKPFIAHGFEWGDSLAHAIHKDLAAAAGNGAQARFDKFTDNFLDGFLEDLLEMDKLARAEPVDIDLRETSL